MPLPLDDPKTRRRVVDLDRRAILAGGGPAGQDREGVPR
jgi:hypothetical protein